MTTSFIDIPTFAEEGVSLPVYSSEWAAGADVKARLEEEIILEPGSSALIPTGLKFQLPEGFEIQVRPRSGLALKHQITVLNTPGTIDADYRGELGVILINHGKQAFKITDGMRIAQIVVAPVCRGNFFETCQLLETARGSGGFGHTGY